MPSLSARNSLPVLFIMYLAKNVIIVSFLDILSCLTNRFVQWCQKHVVLSNYLKCFMSNAELFNGLEESTIQSFIIVCIIEPHETHSTLWTSLYPVLLSSDLWWWNMHQHSKPAMHCRSNWFAPSQHHSAQDVNEMNHWDKKKFPHSNDVWALLAAIWTYQ